MKIEQQNSESTKSARRNLVKKPERNSRVREAKKRPLKKDLRCRKAEQIAFFREFDPGSGLTLAACITHSSRTEIEIFQWRTGE